MFPLKFSNTILSQFLRTFEVLVLYTALLNALSLWICYSFYTWTLTLSLIAPYRVTGSVTSPAQPRLQTRDTWLPTRPLTSISCPRTRSVTIVSSLTFWFILMSVGFRLDAIRSGNGIPGWLGRRYKNLFIIITIE